MGLPAPDGTIAWNGKVPPRGGVVVMRVPDPRWRRGWESGRLSALGTLRAVLVGRDSHRGNDLLAAGQEGS